MLKQIETDLLKLQDEGLKRELVFMEGIDFCSNDYLGLSRSNFLQKELISFIKKQSSKWNTSSRLIHGNTRLHEVTEKYLASFVNRKASLLFNSGYSANLGVIECLCQDSLIFSDEFNHASIIDGIRNTSSQKYIYRHNDLNHLEELLKKSASHKRKFIITESVFSMEGTVTDIDQLFYLSKKYNAFLIIDEAHSTGVFGNAGKGLTASHDFKIDKEQFISIHTCGKAIGTNGAFVACSQSMKNYLINNCRHFIYTTAPSPLQVFQIQKSVEFIQKNKNHVKELWKNIQYMNSILPKEQRSQSQIFSIQVKENINIQKVESDLRNKGIAVKAIRYPTVAKGKERLRVSIHRTHTQKEIDFLNREIKSILAKQEIKE